MRKVSAKTEGAFWCCFLACVLDCSSATFAVSAKQSVRTGIRLEGLRLRGGESGGRVGNMWILTHDIECDAVTLAWEKVENAVSYEIQLKVRKKNLQPDSLHQVRVRAKMGEQWGDFSDPLAFSTLASDVKRMQPPSIASTDHEGITVTWTAVEACQSYCVEMRSNSESSWRTIASSLKSPAMRKKNLERETSYFFRVKPNTGDGDSEFAMSLATPAALLAELPPQLCALLGGASALLVNARGETATAASLAGKVVALYCSASWCGPCRQFTPRLSQLYLQAKQAGKAFEVVFLSCDRDPKSFTEYLSHMPWWGLSYDSPSREQAMAKLGVQGIPMLAVLGANGQMLETNAVQKLSPACLDAWLAGRPA